MSEPPADFDDARVLAYAIIDATVTPTGGTAHNVGGALIGPAARLAIVRYDGDSAYYLFYCDAEWRVITDTCHSSEHDAREQAEFEYHGISARGWSGSRAG